MDASASLLADVRVLLVGDQPGAAEGARLLGLLGARLACLGDPPPTTTAGSEPGTTAGSEPGVALGASPGLASGHRQGSSAGTRSGDGSSARATADRASRGRWDVVVVGEPLADPACLRALAEPRLLARVTGSGGDPAHYEEDLAASCGLAALSGAPAGPPLLPPPGVVTGLVGAHVALAALAGLMVAEATGLAEQVEVSSLRAAMAAVSPMLAAAASSGTRPPRPGNRSLGLTPGGVLPCADGFLGVGVAGDEDWAALARLCGDARLDDPRFASVAGRRRHAAEIETLLDPWLRARTRAELFELAQSWRFPFAPALAPAEVAADPHVRAVGAVAVTGDPAAVVGDPAAVGSEPAAGPAAPADGAGEPAAGRRDAVAVAGDDARGRPGLRPASPFRFAPPSLRPQAPPGRGGLACQAPGAARPPLAGVRVLELAGLWAGPYAGLLLAALGAEVVKLEAPQRPDGTRGGAAPGPEVAHLYPDGRPGAHPRDRCATFNDLNRGKLGLALDLADERGRALLSRLLAHTDVLLESFSPRVMPNFGLPPARVLADHPRLVWVSLPAFGLDGPYRDRVALGGGLELASGLAWLAGRGYGDGRPHLLGAPVTDCLAGAHAALGTLAALRWRARTGAGGHLEVAQLRSALQLVGGALAALPAEPPGPRPPQVPVRDPMALLADPGLADAFEPVAHPAAGTRRHLRPPWRFGRVPCGTARPAPTFGQHSEAVLRKLAGCDGPRLRQLAEDGIVVLATTSAVLRSTA